MTDAGARRFLVGLLEMVGIEVGPERPLPGGVELPLRRSGDFDSERHPDLGVSTANGTDGVDALRNALEGVRDELSAKVLELGWSEGKIERSTYGATLVLRRWPDTWSTDGPGTARVHGASETEAWLNAWRWARENPVPRNP